MLTGGQEKRTLTVQSLHCRLSLWKEERACGREESVFHEDRLVVGGKRDTGAPGGGSRTVVKGQVSVTGSLWVSPLEKRKMPELSYEHSRPPLPLHSSLRPHCSTGDQACVSCSLGPGSSHSSPSDSTLQ